jgi:hypothetical protein
MPPTPTSRLGLLKPDSTDLYNVGIPNGNMDRLDAVGGIQRCLSTSRPSTPFQDQAIKETDTGKILVWAPGSPGSWVTIFNPSDYIYTPPPNGPVFSAVQTVAQSIPNNVWTPLTFSAERIDTDNGHSTSANTSRWVVPTGWAGYYSLSGIVFFATGTTGVRCAALAKNGTRIPGSSTRTSPCADGFGNGVTTGSMVEQLAVGDYVELIALHNQGSAVNTFVTSPETSGLRVAFLRA